MTAIATPVDTRPDVTPTDRLLTAGLVAAPLLYLAADTVYAARGWDDATAGVLHVLAATLYGFALLAVASRLPTASVLRAVLVFTLVVGVAGNVAYGFDTIHVSLGDAALVDRTGAATLIKPLGLFFPLSLLVAAIALGRRWQAGAVGAAALAWPVAHIANIAWLAVAVNVVLVVALAGLPWTDDRRPA